MFSYDVNLTSEHHHFYIGTPYVIWLNQIKTNFLEFKKFSIFRVTVYLFFTFLHTILDYEVEGRKINLFNL